MRLLLGFASLSWTDNFSTSQLCRFNLVHKAEPAFNCNVWRLELPAPHRDRVRVCLCVVVDSVACELINLTVDQPHCYNFVTVRL